MPKVQTPDSRLQTGNPAKVRTVVDLLDQDSTLKKKPSLARQLYGQKVQKVQKVQRRGHRDEG
jgi:hypothetical protein